MSTVGASVLQGAREALAYAKGRKKGSKTHKIMIPEQIDVRAIRDELHTANLSSSGTSSVKKKTA